jgi:hypothetical protein
MWSQVESLLRMMNWEHTEGSDSSIFQPFHRHIPVLCVTVQTAVSRIENKNPTPFLQHTSESLITKGK